MTTTPGLADEPYTPPRWTIDLSLNPRDRYRELAKHYKDQLQELIGLFDDLLHDIAVPSKWVPTVNRASRLLLRRLCERSQTEEIQGISEGSGVPMYLLVAFNVILDLLMGCTSGGVKSLEKGQPLSAAKMLHFRTLDWSMDPLRRVVVQLDFVRSKSTAPEKVIATSITYVGFTGVLTGVRPGLSMSLNFRGIHDNSTKMAQFRFYLHHLLVLVGRRPSIATYLRKYLTGDHKAVEASSRSRWSQTNNANQDMQTDRPLRLAEIHHELCKRHTTAAYLIFSDGDTTISIDKDFQTAKLRQSQSFIATTNHDVLQHDTEQKENTVLAGDNAVAVRRVTGLKEFIDESENRLKCIADRWKRHLAKQRKDVSKIGHSAQAQDSAHGATLTSRQVVNWVSKYPTTNEATHYAAVMDPKAGRVVWCLAYPELLG